MIAKKVYLCGFMGCGKSHVGRLLARKTNSGFIDLDRYISKKENMPISDIFRTKGEPYFREIEAKALTEIQKGAVIATGGGTMINDKTAEYANKNGITIFLDADFDVCYNRIKGDKNRPLAVNNTKEQLLDIFNGRRIIYAKNSCFTVNANTSDVIILENILELLKNKNDSNFEELI